MIADGRTLGPRGSRWTLVVCYAAISLPVIGVGLVSRVAGSRIANAVFGAADLVLAAALVFEIRRARR